MKAHINGIEVEGTPQEIAEYQRIMSQTQKVVDWYKPSEYGYGTAKPWWYDQRVVIYSYNSDYKTS